MKAIGQRWITITLSLLKSVVCRCWVAGLAQYTTAQLSGIVTDKAGAAVAGATVTAQEVQTGYQAIGEDAGCGANTFFPACRSETTI